MSEKDNLKSKTASETTDAEKKTTAKTAVKKSANTAGKAVKAETEKTAEKKTASKKPSTATGKAVKADAETTAEKKTASKKPAASASKTSGTAKKTTATPESKAVRKTSAKKPSAVKQEEIKETSANENETEISTEEIAAPVAEIKHAEAVKAEEIISEEAKTLQENAVTAEERLVGEAEIASSIDSQLSAILSKPEKRVKRDTGMTQEEIRKAQSEMHETYREMSPLKLVARRFFRSRLSIIGLVMIVALFLFAYLGPVAYNRWGEGEADTTPTTITNIDSFETENGSVEEVYEYTNKINSYAGPSADHLLGTDDKGMDVFTRLMYGGRISLMIGFIVVILETLIGVLLGGLAGYFGGWVDSVIMRIVDVFNCLPALPILLIASAIIDGWIEKGAIRPEDQIYVLMVIITIFSWSGVARLVRGQILSLREQEFITATEVMGLPTWRRIFKHLIPNVMPQLIVSMTLGLGSVILYESTLSYLGLGVQLPHAAWGTMISLVNDPIALQNYPLVWLPAGILIVIAVLGFNFVGDGLRDAMDPKAKK